MPITEAIDIAEEICKSCTYANRRFFIATLATISHHMWIFLNDLRKGVAPNTRVTLDDKINYFIDFMDYIDMIRPKLEGYFDVPLFVAQDNFIFSLSLYGDKKYPGYYYNKLEYDEKKLIISFSKIILSINRFYEALDDVWDDMEILFKSENSEEVNKSWEKIVNRMVILEERFEKILKGRKE